MSTSKKNPKRKQKTENFKQKAKQAAAQANIPKTHLVPVPTWQSDADLIMRGDLLEVIEMQLAQVVDSVQKVGQALHFVMQQNIKAGGIKLEYTWNNGEKATEAEVEEFKKQQEALLEARKQQMVDFQENLQKQANAARTGLVGPDGQPIGTSQDLSESEEENDVIEDAEIEEIETDEQPSSNEDGISEE